MMLSGRVLYGSACFLLGLGPVAGCGAGGASSPPRFDEEAPPPVTPGAPIEPTGIENTPTRPPTGLLSDAANAPAAKEGPDSCVGVSAEVELLRRPVDIIIAIDNSGSMDDEARA